MFIHDRLTKPGEAPGGQSLQQRGVVWGCLGEGQVRGALGCQRPRNKSTPPFEVAAQNQLRGTHRKLDEIHQNLEHF